MNECPLAETRKIELTYCQFAVQLDSYISIHEVFLPVLAQNVVLHYKQAISISMILITPIQHHGIVNLLNNYIKHVINHM